MDTTRLFYTFRRSFPGLAPFAFGFSSSLLKAYKLKLRLKFMKKCYNEQVIPKSILPKRFFKLADKPFDEFQRLIFKKHIALTNIEVKEAFKVLNERRNAFNNMIPENWKQMLLDFCYCKLRFKCNECEIKLNRKLKNLIDNSEWTQHANPNFVINLSDKVLNDSEKSALGYGLSFSSTNKAVDSADIAKSFCNLDKFGDISTEDVNICKGIVYGAMLRNNDASCPQRFIKAYKGLKNDENIHLTKADKSNAIVLMNKTNYLDKMKELLSDTETYNELRKNPLETVNSSFNKKIKNIFKNDDIMIKKLLSTSPSLPYMYGLIKVHKPNNPVRPITSSVGSASYNLSKWLVTLLNPLVGRISEANVKNNVDLIDKLNSLDLDYDFKLVSFDVTSLFTKVPVDDLLEFLAEELPLHDLPINTSIVIDLIKLCIKDCKFEFNGKFYAQKFGMAMGNPLSAVLSNIYMEFFETKMLCNILPSDVKWFRYVDDILCIWPASENLDAFLPKLNDLVTSIKFTVETESNSCISFLDCRIHRCDRQFKYSVHRKPTNVNSYIHYYSAHHDRVKQSVFSSMFLRGLRICSPEYVDDEICKIFDIGSQLKYPKFFLDKCLKHAKRTFYRTESRQKFENKNLLVIPYHENFVEIPKILKNFKVNVVFKTSTTVKNMLIKNSPANCVGCVYRIPCKHCNNYYVGQTGKDLEVRLKQHKYSIRTGQESSALFTHVRDFGHNIDWNNASKIVSCKTLFDRNVIESGIIKYNYDTLLNSSYGLYKLDPFISKSINNSYFKH